MRTDHLNAQTFVTVWNKPQPWPTRIVKLNGLLAVRFYVWCKCHFFLFQTHYQHCHLLIIPETNEGKNIFGQYIQIHNLSYIIYLWGASSLTLLIVSCSCADRDLSWRLIASASCTWRNVISSWLGLLLCVLEKQHPHYNFCMFKKLFSNSTSQKLRTPSVYPSQVFPCLPVFEFHENLYLWVFKFA